MTRYQKSSLNLSDFGLGGSAGQGIGSAAGLAQTGAIYGKLRRNAPDWGSIWQANQKSEAEKKALAMQLDSQIESTGILAEARIKAAELTAEAQKSAASDQAKGSMMGSIFGAIGSIGGALIASDETMKNTIEEIEDALTTLRQLRPVSYYYNEEYSSEPERLHYGFIAQDYLKVMPQATYFDESRGKLCIDTSELIGLLVRSIQQLEGRVTRMEAKSVLEGIK